MRYILLVALNAPLIIIAFISFITRYKLGEISRHKLTSQLLMWLVILTVIIGAFPLYNYTVGRPLLDSTALSFFDIAQSTVIVALIYFVNDQRQRIDLTSKRLRDLHQELSIKLSKK